MPLYEVTLTQEFRGEVFINRWNYRQLSGAPGTPTALDLAGALGMTYGPTAPDDDPPAGTLMAAVQSVQASDLNYISATVINLYNDSDFVIIPLTPLAGGNLNAGSAPFVSIGFRGVRTSRAVRNAQKRFGGVPAANIDPGGFIDSSYLATARAAETIFGTPPVGASTTYEFVTLSLRKEDVVIDGKLVRKYSKWPTEAEALANVYPVSAWQVYGRVRSQTSRQYFRGQ